ncbi:MAG: UDP-3-O-(3-hydroxymyristoyl)glucosamine N-acyltransferase [Nitrospirae bacterium]|nr:UDP-3-O-(3-hydroxymyristoyl)glucosamine N-acyltransferase [Nitrospirota bacterium]
MNVKEFAEIVSGELIGDPARIITGVAGVKEAGEGDITFISAPQYIRHLSETKAACVIVKDPVPGLPIPQIKVHNPHYAFAKALEFFYPKTVPVAGISDNAFVADKASIGDDVAIYPFAYISDHADIGKGTVIMPGVFIGDHAKIGKGCHIFPNVTIREGISIGDRVTIHAGTVIGSDGFGYVFEQGEHYKIPQVGGVIIEDDVEIGSNVSIDRATIGNTIIRKGTKIDNLAQIAHNVTIGQKSLIVAQVGIAGSTQLGDFVVMGGQSAVADHSTLESGTMIAAQAGIKGNIAKGVYGGSPAIPHATWLRAQALFGRLPEMNRKIRELENRISRMEKGEDHDEH